MLYNSLVLIAHVIELEEPIFLSCTVHQYL